eukprot:scaffold3472_cov68-Cylindrotheca_fusiformis.AAC.4
MSRGRGGRGRGPGCGRYGNRNRSENSANKKKMITSSIRMEAGMRHSQCPTYFKVVEQIILRIGKTRLLKIVDLMKEIPLLEQVDKNAEPDDDIRDKKNEAR